MKCLANSRPVAVAILIFPAFSSVFGQSAEESAYEDVEVVRGIEFVGCSTEAKGNLLDAVEFIKTNMDTLKNDTNLHRREGREKNVRRRMERKIDKLKFDCRSAVLCRNSAPRDGMHAFGIMTNRLRICYDKMKSERESFCDLARMVSHEFGHAIGIAKDRVGRHDRDRKDRVYQFGWFAEDRCEYLDQDRSFTDPAKPPTEPPPPTAGIMLFPHKNYQGWGRAFLTDTSNLRVEGRQDTTSSIRVLTGRWLVCKDSDFEGGCEVVDADIADTHSLGFGDNISSVAELVPVSSGIEFYEDNGFGGDAESLLPGDSIADLSQFELEDKISSVRVGNGERWEVCEHDNYGGQCILITADTANLSALGFNDKASSIRESSVIPSDGVTLFQHNQYGGASFDIDFLLSSNDIEDQQAAALMSNRIPNLADHNFNDKASSIRVHNGSWQFCEDKNWRGNCILVRANVEDLSDLNFNDKISSAERLYRTNAPHRIVVYEHITGGGESQMFTSSIPNLQGTGLNDKASSLGIIGGWWQTCTDKNYKGKCKIWPATVGDLRDFGYNDQISSIRLILSD